MSTRNDQRTHFGDLDRIVLLEQDTDRHERRMDEWEKQLMEALKEQNERIAGHTKTLVGILVAIATAGVLLALNLITVMAR